MQRVEGRKLPRRIFALSESSASPLRILIVQNSARLDQALARASGLSRAMIQKLLRHGCVQPSHTPEHTQKQKLLKASDAVLAGSSYQIMPLEASLPQAAHLAKKRDARERCLVDRLILFEDADILVVNKPAGWVVHPAPGHWQGETMTDLLRQSGRSLSVIGGDTRPGVVHRLDKGTSGVMVFAKTDQAYQGLAAQFRLRTVKRVYQALVRGAVKPDEGVIDAPLARHPHLRQKQAVRQDGKPAVSLYTCRHVFKNGAASYVECRLQTGRTHQLRVHLAHKGWPLLGDSLYARAPSLCLRQVLQGVWPHSYPALHAAILGIMHPVTQVPLTFSSPLPDSWPVLPLEMVSIQEL